MLKKAQWTESDEDLKFLQQNLLRHIEREFGGPQRKNFAWVFRDNDTNISAGIAGFVHWNWAYVSQLWVSEQYRGQGLGRNLLAEVLQWGKVNQLTGVYIDTFELRVKEFYERQGFVCIGNIPDFPKGHQRFFLYKKL